MAGKRQATSDLNHDNWNDEEEPEERGTFKTANEVELKNRVIKKARRKVATGTSDAADGGSATKSVFSGFSGFGKPAANAATTAASPFSFLAKIPAASSTGGTTTTTGATPTFSFGGAAAKTTAGEAAKSTDSAKTTFSFGSASATTSIAPKTATTAAPTFSFGSTTASVAKDDKTPSGEKTSDYYAKLMGLNQAVSEWIKTHVDKNSLCILTPIFKDYEKYLKELEQEKPKADATGTTNDKKAATPSSAAGAFKIAEPKSTSTTAATAAPTFSFSSSTGSSSTSSSDPATTQKTNGFSFGLKKPEETKETKPVSTPTSSGFSFGLKSTTDSTSTPTSGFTFSKPASTSEEGSAPKPFSFTPGGAAFSFANIKPPEAPAATENDDEDEEPPKNEFKQVVEEDAVYSKKCKVFVKKDGNFVDKGVGTVYLKPIESSGKTQLLVRADTNLGNILVNLIISSAIPTQRMGKNNVMMVCLPTPDVEKPTPMLLRVKTGEEADELLETIEKYKK